MIVQYSDAVATQLPGASERRVLAHGDNLMLVEFRFAKGGIGAPHAHTDHEQVGYIAKGSFEITVGTETKIVCAGDSYYAPKNVIHGVVALEEDSVIVDAFTPKRSDFL